MKNNIFLMITILLSTCAATMPDTLKDFTPITLENDILKLVDGSSMAMSGKQFGKTMQFRLNLNKRRLGEKTAAGMVGFYTFEDKKYSLKSLIELEEKLSKSNSAADQKLLAELRLFLKFVMAEFIELSQPFLVDARGTKSQMMILITEWATKANRKESYLLAWGASKEGEEKEVIYGRIHTFKDFDQFCSDLIYFLETLMRSCPVACEQFKELMKQSHQNK